VFLPVLENIDWTADVKDYVGFIDHQERQEKARIDMANDNLFALVCSIVLYSATSFAKSKQNDFTKLILITFDDVMANLHLRDSQKWHDRPFRYSPNNKWPEHFVNYVATKKEAKASQKFTDKYKKTNKSWSVSDEEIRRIWFGTKVEELAEEVKKEVNICIWILCGYLLANGPVALKAIVVYFRQCLKLNGNVFWNQSATKQLAIITQRK
jgi:hypothetical protein